MRKIFLCALPILAALSACEERKTIRIGEAVECDLTNEKLDGTMWVMWEAMPGGKNRENPMARIKFFREDGEQKIRYTVKSPSEVYTYDCELGKDEWVCREESHLQDWCQSLEVHTEGSCTPEKLKEIGHFTDSPEEVAKEIAAAKETVAKYRNGDNWQRFVLNNNNLGNKLRGLLYAKVNEKKCQLRVTDMYMTVYNGKRLEDSNPVGSNPFVKSEDEFLWENCDQPDRLLDLEEATLPEDPSTIPPKRMFDLNKMVHYHYIGDKTLKAEEGCTYSMDIYAQWRPVKKGEAVQPGEDGSLDWSTSYTWTDPEALALVSDQQPVGIYSVVRNQECGGKKEKIDTVCKATYILP